MDMTTSILTVQQCLDIDPRRRPALSDIQGCDWCRLANEERALETLSAGRMYVWPRGGTGPGGTVGSVGLKEAAGVGGRDRGGDVLTYSGQEKTGDESPRTITVTLASIMAIYLVACLVMRFFWCSG